MWRRYSTELIILVYSILSICKGVPKVCIILLYSWFNNMPFCLRWEIVYRVHIVLTQGCCKVIYCHGSHLHFLMHNCIC